MPLSHLTLTVSHLPTSTSFFLSCLQPLGYQFIGRHDEYIGFGSKPDEPADFWITQEKPGTPAGAAHVAFPAASKEAVNDFFISALKAGGKIHGEPKTRDPESGYYSAAVVDFDGNSIEAVYRPGSSSSRSQAGEPSLKVIKNGSVVSRAKSTKTESVAPARSEVRSISSKTVPAIEHYSSTPTTQSSYEQYDHHLTYPAQEEQKQQQSDNGSKAAKTIIGTLLGATAGAAIAYAIVKDSQSSQQQQQQQPVSQPLPQYSQQASAQSVPATAYQEPPSYRALEAPPPARSYYSAKDDAYSARDDAYSTYSRSVVSKNPRADTVYEETEYYPPNDDGASVYSRQSGVRRNSNGSIYATKELPIRTIEYPPPSRSQTYPCNPSTLISSYVEGSRRGSEAGRDRDDHSEYNDAETEFSSISTIKPARSSHSHSSHRSSAAPSQYSSHSKASHHSSHHSVASRSSAHRSSASARESKSQAGSVYSATRSARNVPLPEGSTASFSVYSNGDSPRDIPLPESATPSTVFLDTVDIDTHITPDDSISQVGEARSHHSRHSRHSKSGASHASHASHASSKRSSKFDEPVRPEDSISQVSTNVSRSSERTVKASGSGSKAPSQAPSKAPSKAPSQAPSKAPSKAPSQAPSKAPSKAGSKVSSSTQKIKE
ncbi:hypothetical protein VTN96DRAFT_8879 [Rasamsonia emersonii]